jgi:TPR repeat protein
MFGMMLAFIAAMAAQPATPVSGAEATFKQAESLKTKEPMRARTLYEAAARQGHAPAQAALGILLFKEGNRSGALRWLKMAADSGEARALLIYGTALFNGDGLPPNRIQGYAMVRRAAAQGLADAVATQSEMELVMPKSELDAAIKLASEPAPATVAETSPPSTAAPQSEDRPATQERTAKTAARPAKTSPARATPKRSASPTGTKAQPATGPWRIQLGAFRRAGAGQELFARLSPRLPGKQASFVPMGSLTRLLVGPYATLAEASAACRALGRQQACMPTKS